MNVKAADPLLRFTTKAMPEFRSVAKDRQKFPKKGVETPLKGDGIISSGDRPTSLAKKLKEHLLLFSTTGEIISEREDGERGRYLLGGSDAGERLDHIGCGQPVHRLSARGLYVQNRERLQRSSQFALNFARPLCQKFHLSPLPRVNGVEAIRLAQRPATEHDAGETVGHTPAIFRTVSRISGTSFALSLPPICPLLCRTIVSAPSRA